MIFLFLILFLWLGFWSAQAGRSFPIWNSWQDKTSWFNKTPEGVIAVTLAFIGLWGWDKIFDISLFWSVILFVFFAAISYAGKQSATWAYLKWEGNKNIKTNRTSTTKPFNDWLASQFGYKLGDEGYSWVWAFTKGFITTMPVACLGAVFQPIGREIASHAKNRLPGDPNFWMEFFGDGFGYTCSCVFFFFIINYLQ